MDRENLRFDVVIVGGGTSGIGAAIWCRDLGLSFALVEKSSRLGGQLHSIYNPISNYPGVAAKNGSDLLDSFMLSVKEFEDRIFLSSEVAKIEANATSVTLADGRKFSARATILATGVRRRRLNIPGEEEFAGKGLLYSGVGERHSVTGARVAIVGGGDAAVENALLLSENAEKVYVIHRGGELSARAEFIQRAFLEPKIEFLYHTEVAAIMGRDVIEKIELIDRDRGRPGVLEVNNVLIRIGVEPNSHLVRGTAGLDAVGYLKVNALAETSLAGIYAIGDVANPVSPTIATAVGTAAVAAKAIFKSF